MNGIKGLLIGLLVLAIAATAAAETELTINGQVRVRYEFDNKALADTMGTLDFGDMRTRIGLAARVDGNSRAFVQFQDSRRLGGFNQFGDRQSGTLNDGKNVDVHQAYLQTDRLFFDNFGMKIGRFEFAWGNQRVFGAVGWSNVGRSWEGGQFWYDAPRFKLTAFRLRAAERNHSFYNADFDILGVQANLKDYHLDLFGFYEFDADTTLWVDDTTTLEFGDNQLDRINIGAFYKYKNGSIDLTANGVYQLGQIRVDSAIDIAAMMFAVEAGYTFDGDAGLRLAAGVDYSSGDDDFTDDKYKTYANSYATGHAFRGHMDYFVNLAGKPYGSAGLMDVALRGSATPWSDWLMKADFHYFQTAADYLNGAERTKDVGMEIDMSIATTKVAGMKLAAGGSVFLPSESFAGIWDNNATYWLWSMMTVDF